MCLIQVMICDKNLEVRKHLYCSGSDMRKNCYLKQCSFSAKFYEEKVVLTITSLWINLEKTQKF